MHKNALIGSLPPPSPFLSRSLCVLRRDSKGCCLLKGVCERDVLKQGQLSSRSEECVGIYKGRHSNGTLIHLHENQNNRKNRPHCRELTA